MRVTSGIAGGIPLKVPNRIARPTTDRVREALFSILGERVVDAAVADLFAGSGALGLEALSRGAKSATFVEKDREAVAAIEANLKKTRLEGKVVSRDVLQWRPSGKFDLVFADPPYKKRPNDPDFLKQLLGRKELPHFLNEGAILVLECDDHYEADFPEWDVFDTRDYGSNRLLFVRR